MSKKNWTPGAWFVMNGCDIFSALGADSGDGVQASATDGWHIAVIPDTATNVGFGAFELGGNVKKANARLIAAAPELYEALEWFAFPGPSENRPSDDELIRMARAALAKARGEP